MSPDITWIYYAPIGIVVFYGYNHCVLITKRSSCSRLLRSNVVGHTADRERSVHVREVLQEVLDVTGVVRGLIKS